MDVHKTTGPALEEFLIAVQISAYTLLQLQHTLVQTMVSFELEDTSSIIHS